MEESCEVEASNSSAIKVELRQSANSLNFSQFSLGNRENYFLPRNSSGQCRSIKCLDEDDIQSEKLSVASIIY